MLSPSVHVCDNLPGTIISPSPPPSPPPPAIWQTRNTCTDPCWIFTGLTGKHRTERVATQLYHYGSRTRQQVSLLDTTTLEFGYLFSLLRKIFFSTSKLFLDKEKQSVIYFESFLFSSEGNREPSLTINVLVLRISDTEIDFYVLLLHKLFFWYVISAVLMK